MKEEKWQTIDNFPNYSVSTFGRIKREDIYVNAKGGVKKFLKSAIMKPSPEGGGYLMASLINESGKKRPKVHRLVAKAFIQNIDNKPEVNHINGDRSDNRVENLEWCTHLENQQKAVLNDRYRHILSHKAVAIIRRFAKNKSLSQVEIAAKFGVHQSTINKIVRNKQRIISPNYVT